MAKRPESGKIRPLPLPSRWTIQAFRIEPLKVRQTVDPPCPHPWRGVMLTTDQRGRIEMAQAKK
jgi:hypothetical protein